MSLLLDLVFVLTDNLVLVIFGLIAWLAARKGKKAKKERWEHGNQRRYL